MLDSAMRFWRSPLCRFLLLGLCLFLFGLEAFGLRLFGRRVDAAQFGDLATWAQSVGTVAAVTVALRQVSQERHDRLADVERAEAKERTQLYCWIAFKEDPPIGWHMYFNNLTPAPINSWVLSVFEDAEETPIGTLDVSTVYPIPPGFSAHRTAFEAASLTRPHCRLDFADSSGQCWRRSSSGHLSRMAEVRLGDQVLARDVTADQV